jgi:hypothetical protein
MKTLIAFCLACALAACASAPTQVNQKPADPIFVATPVSIPVREECHVDAVPEPRWAVDEVGTDASAFDKSKAILAEVEQRRDYGNQLKAAAKKCE